MEVEGTAPLIAAAGEFHDHNLFSGKGHKISTALYTSILETYQAKFAN